MIKNYLTIAFRHLKKQRMYSAIKIGGFALSIAACLLISLFILDEVGYDKNYANADRIYRLYSEWDYQGTHELGVAMPPPLAKAVKNDFPEIEEVGRLMPNNLFYGAGSNQLMSADKMESLHEDGFCYADPEMLKILEIKMVYGDRNTALAKPKSLLLSRKKAEKYFPGQNPIGKIMYLNNNMKDPFVVGGVMEDFPSNTHLEWDFFITLSGAEFWEGEQEGWRSSNYTVYMLLKPGADPKDLAQKMTANIIKNYMLPIMKEGGVENAEELLAAGKLLLQPIGDIHLKSYDIRDGHSHGDIRFVWLFGSVAVFILILACINFINLSTAKSANRAKEVGLRKVIGSEKRSIVFQFLTESTLYSVLSFVIGILAAWALLPFFNSVAAKSLQIPWTTWWFVPSMILTSLLVGLMAGLYPSFYLSAFLPVRVLKGDISRGSKNSVLRNSLVVFQFTTSIILIIGTFVIYRQMNFIMNSKLGYDKEQVLMLQSTHTLDDQVTAFKAELSKLSQVKSVTISDYLPVNGTKRNGNSVFVEGKGTEDAGISTQVWIADQDYVKTIGLNIVSGRNFSTDKPADSFAVLINQALANKLGIREAKDQRISNGWQHFNVVGIVEDFNFESMRQNIEPLLLRPGLSSSIVSLKVGGADIQQTIADVTAVWKKFSPGQAIRYTFLDESFASMYADVKRTQKIFTSFAILAIVIACLGLFALSAFMTEQRRKEVSIRKVLGATVPQVTSLLSRDFVRLVLIAFVIAVPISWWAMTKWLQDYAYKTSLSWWIFGAAGLVVIFIALLTVGFQAINTAIRNPVKSLRAD